VVDTRLLAQTSTKVLSHLHPEQGQTVKWLDTVVRDIDSAKVVIESSKTKWVKSVKGIFSSK